MPQQKLIPARPLMSRRVTFDLIHDQECTSDPAKSALQESRPSDLAMEDHMLALRVRINLPFPQTLNL